MCVIISLGWTNVWIIQHVKICLDWIVNSVSFTNLTPELKHSERLDAQRISKGCQYPDILRTCLHKTFSNDSLRTPKLQIVLAL